jgi:hypothetical protein
MLIIKQVFFPHLSIDPQVILLVVVLLFSVRLVSIAFGSSLGHKLNRSSIDLASIL